jgi:hypothetical protein
MKVACVLNQVRGKSFLTSTFGDSSVHEPKRVMQSCPERHVHRRKHGNTPAQRLLENRLQLGFADRFMRTDGRAVEPALELLDGYFVHDRRRSHLQLETRHGSERIDPVGVTQELQA